MADIFTRRKTGRERPLTDRDLPIPLGVRSNGEYLWYPTAKERRAAARIVAEAEKNARRTGMDRRAFLASSAGMATALAAVNACGGAGGDTGTTGPYETTGSDGGCDQDGSRELLSADEQFVLDVQTHHIDLGAWQDTNTAYRIFYDELVPMWRPDCDLGAECFDFDDYVNLIFAHSDTTVAVLSGLPAIACGDAEPGEDCGAPIDDMGLAASRDRINEFADSGRMLCHAMVIPNYKLDLALAGMERAAKELGAQAWKIYTPWGQLTAEQIASLEGKTEQEIILMAISGELQGEGFWLDDPAIGIPVIEKGLALGVDIFCCHKGLPLPTFDPAFTSCRDLGVLARMFPEARFVAYHSSLNTGGQNVLDRIPEGPYEGPDADPALAESGVNDLVKALLDNDIPPNANLYAELGGVWSSIMGMADEAQHVIGKLLRWVGEDNILWGTDAVWIGTPQPLIESFRAFTITPEFSDKYGYPPLTPEIKDKILGLNAARLYGVDPDEARCTLADDAFTRRRALYREARRLEPRVRAGPLGPRSRREFVRLWWQNRDHP